MMGSAATKVESHQIPTGSYVCVQFMPAPLGELILSREPLGGRCISRPENFVKKWNYATVSRSLSGEIARYAELFLRKSQMHARLAVSINTLDGSGAATDGGGGGGGITGVGPPGGVGPPPGGVGLDG